MIEQELPEGWAETKLGEIFKFLGGGTPDKSNPLFWNGNLPWASVKDIKDKYLVGTQDKITHEAVNASATNIASVGDVILITRINPGRVCISKIESAINQDLKIIKSSTEISSHFAYYLFNCLEPQILKGSSGTTVLGITLSNLYDVKFSLPPLAEQHRIVAKIEELFSELDKGIETLKTAQQQLKVYRQAVLKYAFEGNFTKERRLKGNYPAVSILLETIRAMGRENNVRLKYLSVQYSENLPPIPDTWEWVRNEELLKYVTSGSRDWKQYYSDIGSIFIRTQDIKTNSLDLSDPAFVALPEKVEGKRSLVEGGDLLMTITGANVGRVAVVPENVPEAYVSQSVALLKPLNKKMSKFLWYYFQSRTYGEGLVGGLVYGVGRPVLSLENMREVEVAVCSLQEQHDIVEEIESRLSVCDKIEENIEQGMQQAETLKQSILKRAFEGKLLPQDPNDEPASVLLERIKAERATAQPEKKNRSKKVKG